MPRMKKKKRKMKGKAEKGRTSQKEEHLESPFSFPPYGDQGSRDSFGGRPRWGPRYPWQRGPRQRPGLGLGRGGRPFDRAWRAPRDRFILDSEGDGIPDILNRSLDQIGPSASGSMTRQGPHTCPDCDGRFSFLKVVDKGHGAIRLHCPVCGAELGRIKRKHFGSSGHIR